MAGIVRVAGIWVAEDLASESSIVVVNPTAAPQDALTAEFPLADTPGEQVPFAVVRVKRHLLSTNGRQFARLRSPAR